MQFLVGVQCDDTQSIIFCRCDDEHLASGQRVGVSINGNVVQGAVVVMPRDILEAMDTADCPSLVQVDVPLTEFACTEPGRLHMLVHEAGVTTNDVARALQRASLEAPVAEHRRR